MNFLGRLQPYHSHYRFDPFVTRRWEFRIGPFFQAILGLDQLRVKRIQGELALPFYNGPHLELIQHNYGHREDQRFHWIQGLPEKLEEDVFDFLVLLSMVYINAQYYNDIPEPFEGERADAFLNMLKRRLMDAKEVMGPFQVSVQRREYLMKHWQLFRDIGEQLILRDKKLSDVIKAFDHRNKVIPSYLSSIVNLFL